MISLADNTGIYATKHKKCMTIKQAIKILIRTNKWRRGAEIEMPDPKVFGEAIDVAISIMEVTLVEQPGLKRYHIKAKRYG